MMTKKINLPPNQDRKQRIAVIAAVVVFLAATTWNVAVTVSVQNSNTTSLDQVVDTIEEACDSRHTLTIQYQVRARNQRILARAQLMTTQAFLVALEESPPPPPGTSQEELEIRAKFLHRYRAAIPKLRHILSTTKILPLENCRKQAKELRADLPPK